MQVTVTKDFLTERKSHWDKFGQSSISSIRNMFSNYQTKLNEFYDCDFSWMLVKNIENKYQSLYDFEGLIYSISNKIDNRNVKDIVLTEKEFNVLNTNLDSLLNNLPADYIHLEYILDKKGKLNEEKRSL